MANNGKPVLPDQRSGSVIHIKSSGGHEGTTKRPTESGAERRVDSGKSSGSGKDKEAPMNNPDFGRGSEGGG